MRNYPYLRTTWLRVYPRSPAYRCWSIYFAAGWLVVNLGRIHIQVGK